MNKPTQIPLDNYEDYIDISDLFGLLWVKKWVIILITGGVFSIGVMVISKMPDIYRASTTIMVQGDTPDNPLQTFASSRVSIQEELDTTIRLISSSQFVRVVTSNIKDQYKLDSTHSLVLSNTKKFSESLTVKPIQNTNMLELSFEHSDAEFATFTVNLIANKFIEYEQTLMQPHADKSDEWIKSKVTEVEEKLTLEEEKLKTYRKDNNIVDITSFVNLAKQDISQLHAKKRELVFESERLSRVIKLLVNNQNRDSIPDISKWTDIDTLKVLAKQKAKLDTELIQIKLRYLQKHPKYIAKSSEISVTKQQLNIEFANVLKSLQLKLNEMNQSIMDLDFLRIEAEQQLEQAMLKNIEFEKITRDIASTTQLLESVTSKQKEAELFSEVQYASIIIIDPALQPDEPFKPMRILLAGVVLFIGFALSLIVIFIAKILGNSHKKYYQLARSYNLEVLGELPIVSRFSRYKRGRLFTADNEVDYRLFEECIRSIRTRMLLSKNSEQDKIIAISSLGPREGKSNLLLLLAKSFSEVEDVLVIDVDLRVDSITTKLGYETSHPGLTNYLSETHSINECIISDPSLKIDLLPSGNQSKKPQEFLSMASFEALLSELSSKYDRIILNCPPLFFASDIMLISKYINNINLIIDVQKHTVSELENEIESFIYAKRKINSVIFNKIKVEHKNYYRRMKPRRKKFR
jgi:capsular exopolysaccharide synthesis family protein